MVKREETMIMRFRVVGKMMRAQALSHRTVGLTARASGFPL